MRVLITGATGFVGWHATRSFVEAGHQVRALVRDADKAERVLGPFGSESVDWVVGDMADRIAVGCAIDGCAAAIHAAAHVSVTDARASAAFGKNVTGAQTVLRASVDAGLAPVVFLSSLTAIFDPHGGAPSGDSPLVESQSRYGQSKAASETFARELQATGAPVAIIYPSGVVGPDDTGLSESVRAYRSFLKSTLRVGGTSLVDARDLATLLVRIVEQKRAGRIIAAGHYLDWDALTAILEDLTGARVPRLSAPGWLLRGAGRLADAIGRATGKAMPMSHEGLEIATRWRPIADSPEVALMGVTWRPARETIEDMFRWFLENGRLPAGAVPKLAKGPA